MYLRADIKEEELIFLFNNGLRYCAFGVESGDEEHRNQVLKKNLSDEQLFSTINLLRKFDIRFMAFFMLGTPGENEAIRKKTIELSERMWKLGGYPAVGQYADLSLLQPNEGFPTTPQKLFPYLNSIFLKTKVDPLCKPYLPNGLRIKNVS